MMRSRYGRACFERRHRLLGIAIAQKAQDQPRADTQPAAPVLERMPDAVEYCLESNAAAGVGLRVEEDLGLDDIL